MIVVVDNAIPYIREVFKPWAEVRYRDVIVREDIVDADAVMVRTRTRCDEVLLGGTRVKMVASATVGTDHIDTDYCRRAGIKVANAPGSNARGVLQWVAAVLAQASADGKLLGVVGVGHVGSLVAEYARKWGFEVLCCDPPRAVQGFVSLDEIAVRADIITFHTPLTFEGPDATYHLADDNFFSKVKPGAMILNSSRGEVVDTRALMNSGCDFCIDTWEHEPDIDREMLHRAFLATPHIAGYSIQGKANATAAAVRAIAKEFEMPLEGWYPAEMHPTVPQPIKWEELCATIYDYFDIAAETHTLKSAPEKFEQLRNNYRFREEYF